MINFRTLVHGFRNLGLERDNPVLVHCSVSAFGEIQGGADTLQGALLAAFGRVMVPSFTYRTMLTPLIGPERNALVYGAENGSNFAAQFFTQDLPADRLMGVLADAVRRHPSGKRSRHPILSFAGIGLDKFLGCQTLDNPLAPIGTMAAAGGWVVLLGVDHTVNTSIHYGEMLAGRKRFTRWALTPSGVVECRNIPGCSQGFNQIAAYLGPVARQVQVGDALVQAIPMDHLIQTVYELILADAKALLCPRDDCARCQEVRINLEEREETHLKPLTA